MSTSTDHLAALHSPIERRFYPRVTPSVLVYVAFGANNLGMLLNVSENGLLVSTPRALDLNSVYRISLRLSGLPNAIKVHVRTVWTAEPQKRAGTQLLDLSEHDREQIRRWGVLQPSLHESVERWFSPENTDSSPETIQPRPPVLESSQALEPATALAVPSPSLKDAQEEHRPAAEAPAPDIPLPRTAVVRNIVARRVSTRSAKPALIMWTVSMLAICLATAWTFRHTLADRLLNRAAYDGKAGDHVVNRNPMLNTRVALPSSVDLTSKQTSPPTIGATAAPKMSPPNPAASGSVQAKARGARRSAINLPKHSAEVTQTREASDSDVADSNSESFPTNDVIPARASALAAVNAPPEPTTTESPQKISTADDSATKIASSEAPPSRSAITGSISNSTRPSNPSAGMPSDNPAMPAPRPALTPVPTAGSATYPERKSDPEVTRPDATVLHSDPAVIRRAPAAVIHMDVPETHTMELTIPRGHSASFVRIPGERVVRSAGVTIHIQRSILVSGEHWWWPASGRKRVALGELTSRVDPQISRLPTTFGTITVQATIDKNGDVANVRPLNGSFAFLPNVAKAIREWHYEPTFVDNKLVETQAQIEVDFHPPASRPSHP